MEVYTKVFWDALLVGIYCGVVGVLVDFDHIIAFILKRDNTDAKILHTPLFIITGIVFIGIIAYIGGLAL
jgi:hypothetical protein